MPSTEQSDVQILTTILESLKNLDQDSQKRILQSVSTFLGISDVSGNTTKEAYADSSKSSVTFSENRDISPKDFLRDKAPSTDIERIACLAYYLTHYRDTPHFKTIDLSSLNTEAAQPKLSNAAFSVTNATNAGLLVPAGKGSKQLSSAGELFVHALPDRELARESIRNMRPKRKAKKITRKPK